MPPAAPEYVPAGIQRPSALPVTPTEPTPIPQNATPPAPEPTIAPEAPLEPTSAAVPGRQFFAPPLPPEDPSTNWDLAPLEEESVFELPPHPRRASDRPTSNRKEERSAVEELGDGPIARHHRLMERPAKVARSDPRGHTSAPVETQLVVRSNSPK